MKGKRFSVEQIVAVLKQVELGLPVADAIRARRGFRSRRSTAGRSAMLAFSRSRCVSSSSFRRRMRG